MFCDKLIISTGMCCPNIPKNVIDRDNVIKHYSHFEKGFFEKENNLNTFTNQNVLIIGNGNSAFELANILSQYCATIVIMGKDQPRLSITTHYTGDVHSKYMDFYDTFLLKSLNAFDSNERELYVTKQGEKIHVEYFCSDCPNPHARYRNIAYFDRVINCTGWKIDSSIFDESMNICLGSKFPQINGRYEHVNYPNLFL